MLSFKANSKTKFGLVLKEDDVFTKELVKELGDILLEDIVFEVRRTQARHRGMKRADGDPVGIPLDPKFADSLWVKTTLKSLEVGSSWPMFDVFMEGKKAYPMPWLTRQEGVSVVPVGKGPLGTVLFRTTPKTRGDAWIHPGFEKQSFFEDGLRRATPRMQRRIEEQVQAKLAKIRYL
jgi:hypothetical protein